MNPTSTSYLLQKVAPLVMREIGPRVGPFVAERVGIPLAKKVGLPIARRIGIPIARKTGTLLLNRVGYPLVNKMLIKVNITPPDMGNNLLKKTAPTPSVTNQPTQTPATGKSKNKTKKLKEIFFSNRRNKTKSNHLINNTPTHNYSNNTLTPVPPINPVPVNPTPINQNPAMFPPQIPSPPDNYQKPPNDDSNPYMNYNSSLFSRRRHSFGYDYSE